MEHNESMSKITVSPLNPGDFRDGQGILHCGKCGAFLEYVQRADKIKKPPFYDTLDEEQKKRVDDMRNFLTGRCHRIPCRCKEDERRAYEKAQRKQYIKDNMNYCFGKLPRLFDYIFEIDDSKDSKTSITSRRYADGFKKYADIGWGITYVGDVGHGKTFYACAIANKLLQDGFKVKFTTINDIVSQVNRYYLPLSSVIDNLCENDLIIIDDFGTEATSNWMHANTFQIINTLSERKKPLIITTNIKADTLRNAPDTESKRVYSRIVEHSTICEVRSEKGDRRQPSA